LWDDIQFPFDSALRGVDDLTRVNVSRTDESASCEVKEEYSCDASGMVKVTIRNLSLAYRREYTLGRWSSSAPGASQVLAPR
jgi:hypothetical protein